MHAATTAFLPGRVRAVQVHCLQPQGNVPLMNTQALLSLASTCPKPLWSIVPLCPHCHPVQAGLSTHNAWAWIPYWREIFIFSVQESVQCLLEHPHGCPFLHLALPYCSSHYSRTISSLSVGVTVVEGLASMHDSISSTGRKKNHNYI